MRVRRSVGRCVAALALWTQVGRAQVDVPLADAPSQPPAAEAPAPHHPEPRVVVNVTSIEGPHARGDVERAARLAWGRIVSCYKAIDPRAKGLIRLELAVAGHGKVTDARRTQSTLKNRELAACLTGAMKGLDMPKARAGSTAHTEIHVAPGDPPRTEASRRTGRRSENTAGTPTAVCLHDEHDPARISFLFHLRHPRRSESSR